MRRKMMKPVLTAACCIVLFLTTCIRQRQGRGSKGDERPAVCRLRSSNRHGGSRSGAVGRICRVLAASQGLRSDAGRRSQAKDYNQLYDVAHQANLNMPNAIDAEHNKAMIDTGFQKLKGAAFDRHYAQEMVAGHTKAIAIYKKEAADAQNAALKSYAAQVCCRSSKSTWESQGSGEGQVGGACRGVKDDRSFSSS